MLGGSDVMLPTVCLGEPASRGNEKRHTLCQSLLMSPRACLPGGARVRGLSPTPCGGKCLEGLCPSLRMRGSCVTFLPLLCHVDTSHGKVEGQVPPRAGVFP